MNSSAIFIAFLAEVGLPRLKLVRSVSSFDDSMAEPSDNGIGETAVRNLGVVVSLRRSAEAGDGVATFYAKFNYKSEALFSDTPPINPPSASFMTVPKHSCVSAVLSAT